MGKMIMKMLKKKSKLLYRFQDESRNTKDIAEELIKGILVKVTPTSSCWWSKMKARVDSYKDEHERIKHQQIAFLNGSNIEPDTSSRATVKTCPGILGLFKQTYLIKSPTEIIITINKDGGYYYNISDNSIINIQSHSKEQFYQEDNTFFKDKISIKFLIGLNIKTTDFKYMFTDPTYHNNSGCFVPMGIVNDKYGKNQELNIITLIDVPKDEETRTIIIKEGDVIAYLVTLKDCDIEFSEENFIAKKLISSFQFKHMF